MTLEEHLAAAIETAFWAGDTFGKKTCKAPPDEQRAVWMRCAKATIEAGRAYRLQAAENVGMWAATASVQPLKPPPDH